MPAKTGRQVVEVTTYTAITTPDSEHGWLIRVPGLGSYPEDGLPTWARSLRDVEPMARDLIAIYLDVPADSFSVAVRVDLPEKVCQHLERVHQLRQQAAEAQASAAEEYRHAASGLKEAGLTVRDIGIALGISYQRAQQLVSAVPAV